MALSRESIKRDYSWINKELLENALREKYQNSKIEVIEFDAVPAIGPGENYASVVIRVHMKLKNFETESLNAVFKVNHVREDLADAINEMNIFGKETLFYKSILNRVHEMLRSIGINAQIGAELIADNSNPSYVMFEDLKLSGFGMMNKFIGLDYDHLKMTLSKSAYWHAATAVLGENEPNSMDNFRDSALLDETGPFVKAMSEMYTMFGKEAATWPGYEEIGKKIQIIAPQINARGKECFTANPKEFNALNHGDLWVCNIMYKHNESTGKLEDVVPVDYSIGSWGNPALDVSYFLYSSSAEHITEEDWDNLLQHYYSVLTSTLKVLGYPKPIPRFFDFYLKYLEASRFTCLLGIMIASIRQLVDGTKGTLGNFLDNTPEAMEFKNILLKNPKFRVSAERLFKYYNRKGLLD